MTNHHPRQETMNLLRRQLHARLWDAMNARDLDYFQMAAAVARHQAVWLRALARTAAGLAPDTEQDTITQVPDDESDAVAAIAATIDDFRLGFSDVTAAELMLVLAEFQVRVAGYTLRWERSGKN